MPLMSESAPAPQDPVAPATAEAYAVAIADAEWRLQMSRKLAEVAMKRASEFDPEAPATPAAEMAPARFRDPDAAFATASRVVRLALACHAKASETLLDLKCGIVRARDADEASAPERAAKFRRAREALVKTLVMNVAEGESENIREVLNFHEALEERLDWDEGYSNFEKRPLRETVERLCKDLCLDPDWSRWDGEGWKEDDPPARYRFSAFNTPSRKALLDDEGGPLVNPEAYVLEEPHDLE
jgi:hypothetical protein